MNQIGIICVFCTQIFETYKNITYNGDELRSGTELETFLAKEIVQTAEILEKNGLFFQDF